MGTTLINCKAPGMGQCAKLANNLALAIQMESIAEAMVFADKMGLDKSILTNIMKSATTKYFYKLLESSI